jgi:hypothetical protein
MGRGGTWGRFSWSCLIEMRPQEPSPRSREDETARTVPMVTHGLLVL